MSRFFEHDQLLFKNGQCSSLHIIYTASGICSKRFSSLPLFFLLLFSLFFAHSFAIILSGAPNSYARYPKWAHTFENELSLDFRTKSSNALLLYVDDGGIQGNFYSLTIADGKLQLDFSICIFWRNAVLRNMAPLGKRPGTHVAVILVGLIPFRDTLFDKLGDDADLTYNRPTITMRVDDILVNDNNWHRLALFQVHLYFAWENIKLQLDDVVKFKILNQQNFAFGNLKTSSDVFVGGVPKDIHLFGSMSSPLKRHTKTFNGNIKNLVYRLHPQGMRRSNRKQGVTSPQLIEGVGIRQSDDDYCKPTGIIRTEEHYCKNDGYCYSTNEGPKCDCSFSDYGGRRCDQAKTDAELSFFGQEWLGYDVGNNSAAVIRSRFENISFSFKTVHGKALIFIIGDQQIARDGAQAMSFGNLFQKLILRIKKS
ncbi:unnamed protein product [Dracunculus medinensis]|uniref:EGF-like domain-containing protein n=1 Tax=Dracunculus medinensis TaxID=318479 RepID=A0A0N4U161_DRAME|nr:unnamed protein product [Dracunculus medinensis]